MQIPCSDAKLDFKPTIRKIKKRNKKFPPFTNSREF